MPVTESDSNSRPIASDCRGRCAKRYRAFGCKTALVELAAALGPLPHASLHVDQSPLTVIGIALDRPKKQRARTLEAHCADGGGQYFLRIAAKPVKDIGPPHCPKHGAMVVEVPPDKKIEPEGTAGTAASV